MVKLPYKYPYLTVFIVGYYTFEHLGYYYKIRKWLGYKEVEKPSYLIDLTDASLGRLNAMAPMFVWLSQNAVTGETREELEKAARKAKERKRSGVIYGAIDCNAESCDRFSTLSRNQGVFLPKGATEAPAVFSGELRSKKILKFVANSQKVLTEDSKEA
jgi:hypothetical protein